MPAKEGFELRAPDIDFLRSVYLLRLATIDHLAALSATDSGDPRSYTRVQKRTAKLSARGYLTPLTKRPAKRIYALGKEGVEVLVELGYAPDDLLERRPREKELKPLFLEHSLFIKDIQVKLLVSARGTSISIPVWDESRRRHDAVEVEVKRGGQTAKTRIPVCPDAFFVLCDSTRPEGKNRMPLVLEADRSEESHERLRTKITGYLNYYRQGLALKKWNVSFFRVLIVTLTTERAENLKKDLRTLIPPQLEPHYIFTDVDALTLDMLLS